MARIDAAQMRVPPRMRQRRTLLVALLRPDLVRAMRTTVPTGGGFGYGLGIISGDAPCATIWGHNGDYVGYFDFAISSDNADRQVVLMMNIDDEANVPPAADTAFTTALLTSFCPA